MTTYTEKGCPTPDDCPDPDHKHSPSDTNKKDNTEIDELDKILSQAFTDGASDTMWQGDRHIEIFNTAKAALETIITQRCIDARKDELEKLPKVKYKLDGEVSDLSILFQSQHIKDRIAALSKEAKEKDTTVT